VGEGKDWKKEEDFLVWLLWGLQGFGFCLMFEIRNSGMTFSGLFSKYFLHD